MTTLIETLIRPEIRELSAYHVQPSADVIKLDAMENPYQMPDELMDEWLAVLRDTPINRYPEPSGQKVIEQLRVSMNIPSSQSILLGNGSDELIQVIAMAIANGGVIMSPEPSFVMYRMIAKFVAMEYVGLPLNQQDFSLDLLSAMALIEQCNPAIIFLAYPNNPTGNHWDRADIEKIIESAPGLVVVDEAYEPFASDSFMKDLEQYPNLLVMRTLSKFGFAGLRLGYLVGAESWLNEFDKIRLPYNINSLTQATASFALQHQEIFVEQAEKIKADRAVMSSGLSKLTGVEVFSSDANFILFRVAAGQAAKIHSALLDAGILIKKLDGSHPALHDCLRVTVGTPMENQKFLEALEILIPSQLA